MRLMTLTTSRTDTRHADDTAPLVRCTGPGLLHPLSRDGLYDEKGAFQIDFHGAIPVEEFISMKGTLVKIPALEIKASMRPNVETDSEMICNVCQLVARNLE